MREETVYDTLLNRICHHVKNNPEKIAVAFKKERLTYLRLGHKIWGVYTILRKYGVTEGDKVVFSTLSKPESVVIYLALNACKATAVFLDKNATAENMHIIYDKVKAKVLLTDKSMKSYADKCNILSIRNLYNDADNYDFIEDSLYEISLKIDQSAISEILFTSGTTDAPKGVMLSFHSVYHIMMNTINGIGITENEKVLIPVPLHHSFALRVLRATLYIGGTAVLQNGFTFAKETENNINDYSCTGLACVPASYEVLKSQMQEAFQSILSRLRYIEFGAGALSVKQRKEITNTLPGVIIHNTWGSSETGGVIFCNVNDVVTSEDRCSTLGVPIKGAKIGILDENGHSIESDKSHPGRMTIQGNMLMSGYWDDEDLTNSTLRDGCLLTGDLAYICDGYVYMVGRADDLINVGGEKVSPVEVENIAGQYEYIRECACIGVDDPEGVLGKVPALFVIPKAGYKEDDFIRFFASRAERYKLPKIVIALRELPRNRMKKIDREKLLQYIDKGPSVYEVNSVVETILNRRSIRKFSDKDIDQDTLDIILKCGYYAPSGHNMQTWRFTVLTKEDDICLLREATKTTAKNNDVYFYGFENPKVIILISNDERNPNGCQDASCAAENIMLAATSYGIGSVWLNPLKTLRNAKPVKDLLDDYEIPKRHIIWSAVALGYPASQGNELQKKTDVIHYV